MCCTSKRPAAAALGRRMAPEMNMDNRVKRRRFLVPGRPSSLPGPLLSLLWLGALALILASCNSEGASLPPTDMAIAAEVAPSGTPAPTSTPVVVVSATPPHTATARPSSTPSVTPLPTATATATLTPTPIGPCQERIPEDDLLTLVSRTYPLSRYYQPADLTPIGDHFSVDVTLGYPTEIRQVAMQPLVDIISAMQAEGLRPFIISGYRSYAAQAIARDKWATQFPDWVDNISAVPGTSEHQLGTTVDFGSPELPEVVGQADVEFHTYFYMTSEGAWLLENAHHYGFTLSYPRDTLELTGFYYEPWHYRYVGVEMATMLKEQGITLTAYLLENFPIPCIP